MVAAMKIAIAIAARKNALLCSWLFVLMLISPIAEGAITTSVNRNHIDRTDNLILNIQVTEDVRGSQPNFSPLQQDWRILATSNRSEISWVNGRLSTATTWRLTLAPLREGILEIPALVWGNSRSQPIRVRVAPISESLEQQLARVAFFRSSVTPEKVWVQSQLLYEVALFYTQEVQLQGNPLQQPKIPDTIVLPLGTTQTGNELIDGVRYWTLKQRYAIYPQTSGKLVIPAMRGLGYAHLTQRQKTRKRVEIRSERYEREVLPKPASYPAGVPWIPASHLELNSEWQGVPSPLHVGDVATLTIRTQIQGLPAASIADLPSPTLTSGRLYSHPQQSQESLSRSGATSHFTNTIAVIPTEGGPMALSPVKVVWWDTDLGQVLESVLNIPTLDVVQTASEAVAPPLQPQQQQPFWAQWLSNPWLWTSAIFAVAWLASFGYILRLRHLIHSQLQPHPTTRATNQKAAEAADYQAFISACRQGDATAIRQTLEAWALSRNPHSQGSALADLLHNDPQGQKLVESLNRHLYQDEGVHFDPMEMLRWTKKKREKQPQPAATEIAPLYPSYSAKPAL